jgi:hypothetical protein
MPTVNPRKTIAVSRLANQQISRRSLTGVDELVSYMCAMQAQDYPMAKLAIGKRLPDATDDIVEAALASGEVLRTHLMRPTWHFVAAADIHWLLALTAPNIASAMKSRHSGLGLSGTVVRQCNRIIERALVSAGALTREEIGLLLQKAGVATKDNNRLAHILLCAELDGLICSGPPKGTSLTYALLGERVPRRTKIDKEEALAKIALRYFTSRGPASLQDFVWWSGLPVGDAKRAVELVRTSLVTVEVGSSTYWSAGSGGRMKGKVGRVHLLPAFDEFLIAYRDRSATLAEAHLRRTVSTNGIFRPIVIVDGEVAGMWKRSTGKDGVTLAVSLFHPATRTVMKLIGQESRAIAAFLKKEVKLLIH